MKMMFFPVEVVLNKEKRKKISKISGNKFRTVNSTKDHDVSVWVGVYTYVIFNSSLNQAKKQMNTTK